jgi:curved DNA-binding protein CbpA
MAVKSFYEVLDIPPTASPDEIRRAFRRSLARYHPDKVQHLGKEFHEIAAAKTAEITGAYRALSNPSSRAGYNERVATTPVPASGDRGFSADRAEAMELVRRAVLGRVRNALRQELGACEEPSVDGFDVAGVSQKTWRRAEVRVLVRLVPVIDKSAVQEIAARARRLAEDRHRKTCVLVMGQAVAPVAELGKAIDDLRRRSLRADRTLVIVPVDIRTWCAHIPADAPIMVRALVERLQAA